MSMKKEFNLNVKIIDDGKESKTYATIEGVAKGANILAVLLEVVPELLGNKKEVIDMFCFLLKNGRKPSNDGVGQTTKIDLSGFGKRGGQ